MSNDLVDASDLAHLPGYPFTEAEVDDAVANVRAACEWHVAPERSETVVLDVVCGESRLRLPTRRLVSVEEIVDLDTETAIAASSYRVSAALGQVFRKFSYWPTGYGRLQVEFTHGYEEVPRDLLAVLGESITTARRDQSVKTLETLDFQAGFGAGGASITSNPIGTGGALERYRLWQLGIA